MKNKYYIAYGSNLNLRQMAMRCPTAKKVAYGEIKDYRMLFRGDAKNAYATIEKATGETVPVLVWSIQEGDEKRLDRYEGFPHFYHKEYIDIEVNGEKTEAMVYIMDSIFKIGMPSKQYLNTILEGYEAGGLNPSALENALDISVQQKMEQNENRLNL